MKDVLRRVGVGAVVGGAVGAVADKSNRRRGALVGAGVGAAAGAGRHAWAERTPGGHTGFMAQAADNTSPDHHSGVPEAMHRAMGAMKGERRRGRRVVAEFMAKGQDSRGRHMPLVGVGDATKTDIQGGAENLARGIGRDIDYEHPTTQKSLRLIEEAKKPWWGRSKSADIATELKPHQKRVVDRIRTQPGLVVAHQPGAGKSLASLAAAEDLGGTASVVVPASLSANYHKEIKKHVTSPKAKYRIESLQRVSRSGSVPRGDLLIVDEAHRLRDPGSKAQKAIEGSTASKRLLLTGTPLYNRPHDLAGLVNIAAGERVLPKDQAEFDARYLAKKQVSPGLWGRLRGVQPGTRTELANKEELGRVLRKWVDYHETGSEDFPHRTDHVVQTRMGPEQQDLYDAVMAKAPAWVRYKVRKGLPPNKQESKQINAFLNAGRQVAVTPGGFVEGLSPLEAASRSPKIQEAHRRLTEAIKKNPEHRAVIYSNYLDSGVAPYEALLERDHIPYGKFTGQMKRQDRDEMVQAYNAGRLKALLLSSAGGEGLDLQGTRQVQVLDPHWNKEKLEQVIGRGIRFRSHAHLPEDQRHVDVEHYVSTLPEPGAIRRLLGAKRPGSVDEYLRQISAEKDQLNQQVREILRSSDKTAGETVTSYDALESKLQPGDIVLASTAPPKKGPLHKRLTEKVFRWISRSLQGDLTHSAIYTGDGKVVEARIGEGTKEKPLREALNRLDARVVRPLVGEATRLRAATSAKLFAAKGIPYDAGALPKLLLAETGIPVSEADVSNKLVCSNLITKAYQGVKFTDKPKSLVMPKDFARSPVVGEVVKFRNPGRYDKENRP